MRISDWSSDVCSSDLRQLDQGPGPWLQPGHSRTDTALCLSVNSECRIRGQPCRHQFGQLRVVGLPDVVSVEAFELGVVEAGGGPADAAEIEPLDGLCGADDLVVAVPPAEAQQVVAQRLRQVAHLPRSEEHTSELQSLMRISYAVFCLKK